VIGDSNRMGHLKLLRTRTLYPRLIQIQKHRSLICYSTPGAKQPGSQEDAKQPPQPYQRVRIGGGGLRSNPPYHKNILFYREVKYPVYFKFKEINLEGASLILVLYHDRYLFRNQQLLHVHDLRAINAKRRRRNLKRNEMLLTSFVGLRSLQR